MSKKRCGVRFTWPYTLDGLIQHTPMLHIIWSIIVGFVVGLIARAIMPGMQHLGFVMTTVLGIGGSVVGGLIARLFSKPAPGSSFHTACGPAHPLYRGCADGVSSNKL